MSTHPIHRSLAFPTILQNLSLQSSSLVQSANGSFEFSPHLLSWQPGSPHYSGALWSSLTHAFVCLAGFPPSFPSHSAFKCWCTEGSLLGPLLSLCDPHPHVSDTLMTSKLVFVVHTVLLNAKPLQTPGLQVSLLGYFPGTLHSKLVFTSRPLLSSLPGMLCPEGLTWSSTLCHLGLSPNVTFWSLLSTPSSHLPFPPCCHDTCTTWNHCIYLFAAGLSLLKWKLHKSRNMVHFVHHCIATMPDMQKASRNSYWMSKKPQIMTLGKIMVSERS